MISDVWINGHREIFAVLCLFIVLAMYGLSVVYSGLAVDTCFLCNPM